MSRRFGWVVLAVAASALLSACGDDDEDKSPAGRKTVKGTFVGRLPGTKALVAVVAAEPKRGADSREARVYVCDGRRIFEWFTGHADANKVELESDDGDASVRVALKPNRASGTVRLAGEGVQTFAAVPARGVAGLYIGHVSRAGVVTGRSETGARIEGRARGDTRVGGQLYPPSGEAVDFTFAGRDFKPVDFRLIVHPSGELQGARAKQNAQSGFRLWDKAN